MSIIRNGAVQTWGVLLPFVSYLLKDSCKRRIWNKTREVIQKIRVDDEELERALNLDLLVRNCRLVRNNSSIKIQKWSTHYKYYLFTEIMEILSLILQ